MPVATKKRGPEIPPGVFVAVIVIVLAIAGYFGFRAVSDPVQKPVFTPAPFGTSTSSLPGGKSPLPEGMTPQGMTPPAGRANNPYGAMETSTGN